MSNSDSELEIEKSTLSSSNDSLSRPIKRKMQPKKVSPKSKQRVYESPAIGWMFVLNNYTDEDIAALEDFLMESCKYGCWQEEVGELGTPHIQMYFELKKKRKYTPLMKDFDQIFSQKPWIQKRKDNRAACIKYCTKEASRKEGTEFHTHGENKGERHRRDIDIVVQLCQEQAPLEEFMEKVPGTFLRYHKGIEKMQAHHSLGRDFKSQTFIFYGQSGAGKTQLAMQFPNIYKVPVTSGNTTWFDRYDPNKHTTVIFDDYYGGIKWTELMQILDRYQHQVHTKGGFVNFKPQFIIFTSNVPPEQWYQKLANNINMWPAFLRRIDVQIKFINQHYFIYEKGSDLDFPNCVKAPAFATIEDYKNDFPSLEESKSQVNNNSNNNYNFKCNSTIPKNIFKKESKIIPPLIKPKIGVKKLNSVPKIKPLIKRAKTDHGWEDQPVNNKSYYQDLYEERDA